MEFRKAISLNKARFVLFRGVNIIDSIIPIMFVHELVWDSFTDRNVRQRPILINFHIFIFLAIIWENCDTILLQVNGKRRLQICSLEYKCMLIDIATGQICNVNILMLKCEKWMKCARAYNLVRVTACAWRVYVRTCVCHLKICCSVHWAIGLIRQWNVQWRFA